MTQAAIEFDRVWKKFQKGEYATTLRDAVADFGRRLAGRGRKARDAQRDFWALKDVSFRVDRGECLGIIGPNGAGKSTILKLLSGILRPNRGSTNVNGRLSCLIEVAAGFHLDLTGRENIFLNGTILGMSAEEIESKLEDIIEFSGIREFIDTPVKRYSSGMFARLGFSVASHVDPDVLLVDEVLSVGDMFFQGKCMEKMREIRARNSAMIFVSHNLHSVLEICDRCIFLDGGRIRCEGEPAKVVHEYVNAVTHLRRQEPSGDSPVVFERVTMLGADGVERTTFQPGERAKIVVEAAFRAEVPSAVFGCFILSEKEEDLYDRISAAPGQTPHHFLPGQRFRLEYTLTLNFNSGRYHVGCHLKRIGGEGEFIEYVRNAFGFVVEGRSHARGLVYTDDEFSMTQIG